LTVAGGEVGRREIQGFSDKAPDFGRRKRKQTFQDKVGVK